MASAAIFSSLRRSRSPTLEAFLAPVDLQNDLILSFSGKPQPFQKKNSKSLLRNIELFVVLLDSVQNSTSNLPSTVILCLKELYLLLYMSKTLLQDQPISGQFHDLNQEFSILDVIPLQKLDFLSSDVKEQLALFQKQSRNAKLFVDKLDDALRLKFFKMLNEIETGSIPSVQKFHEFFRQKIGDS